jgi:hypothetical protein
MSESNRPAENQLDCPTCGQGHEGAAADDLRAKLAARSSKPLDEPAWENWSRDQLVGQIRMLRLRVGELRNRIFCPACDEVMVKPSDETPGRQCSHCKSRVVEQDPDFCPYCAVAFGGRYQLEPAEKTNELRIPWGAIDLDGKWIPHWGISFSPDDQRRENIAQGVICKCGYVPSKCRCPVPRNEP